MIFIKIILKVNRYFIMKTITFLLIFLSVILNAQKRQFWTYPDLENKIGTHFPIENYKNSGWKNFNANDLKGKISFINFWSTHCEPCLEELPYLNKLKEFSEEKVNFIAITYDSKEQVDAFLAKRPFNFQHITDSGQELRSYFTLLRNPMTFIVDKNGNIEEITGAIEKTKFDILQKILKESF